MQGRQGREGRHRRRPLNPAESPPIPVPPCKLPLGRSIVAVRSFGRGIADNILRGAGCHPVGSCSKYCIGLAALGVVPQFNKFLPAFRRLLPHLEQGQIFDIKREQSTSYPL